MKNAILAILLALCVTFPVYGQSRPTIIQGQPDGVYVVRITGGVLYFEPAVEPGVIPAPVVPVNPVTPVVPVVPTPTIDLKAAATAAIASIPGYADRETNLRQIATLVGVILPNIPDNANPSGSSNIEALKRAFRIATGKNEPSWAGFWAAIDPHLAACQTNAQFVVAVKTIHQAIIDSLPDSSGDEEEVVGGFPTYGAQADMDGKLGDGKFLAWMIANLPEILAIIRMFVPQIPNIPLPF